MVRPKNMLSTMMLSAINMGMLSFAFGLKRCISNGFLGLISVHWYAFGYSFAFGGGNVFYGSGEFVGLRGVSLEPSPQYGTTIPHIVYCMYQLMFSIISVSIVSGAIVERMSFRAWVIFSLLWTTLVYDTVGMFCFIFQCC